MYRNLKLTCEGRLARLTLDRPERRNAFSAELMRELIAAAADLAARRDVDAVIVNGSGGVFSAGADLKDATRWAGGAPLLEQRETSGLGGRMARAWEELPQMTVAAIEGYAIGGGLAFAAALDWRVMASDAFVSLPEISLGIPLTWGTLPRLVNLVGRTGRGLGFLSAWFDRTFIDGAVNGVGAAAMGTGSKLRILQSGLVRSYALGIGIGAVLLLAFFVTRINW